MNCANIWGPSDHSGRLQRPKPKCPSSYKVGLMVKLEIILQSVPDTDIQYLKCINQCQVVNDCSMIEVRSYI